MKASVFWDSVPASATSAPCHLRKGTPDDGVLEANRPTLRRVDAEEIAMLRSTPPQDATRAAALQLPNAMGVSTAPRWPSAGRDRSDSVGEWSPLAAATWLQDFNSAWLRGRWSNLENLLCPDVEFTTLGSARMVSGRTEVVGMFRRRYSRLDIHEFSATEVEARRLGAIGILQFRWFVDWHESMERVRRFGCTTIGLRLLERPWKALWIKEARG
ncbi:MAG: nuclear transport factor 2 family protein [Proteobacteria bacterium]|nr:nuclear transport factor 2 family protein [Pseudomonadota bacterium]